MGEQFQLRNEHGVVRMVMTKYEGYNWPSLVQDPVALLKEIKNFQYQDGDLIICSYPRTGANWTLDMLHMLRNNTTDINNTMSPPLEMLPAHNKGLKSPRTMLTHLPYRLMPPSHEEKGGKIILLCRNPKDTAVSNFRIAQKSKLGGEPFSGDFEEFLHYFTKGEIVGMGYSQYFQEWDQVLKANPDLPFLIIHYEDMKEDCISQLRRICNFLEIDRSDEFLQEVAEKNNITAVKAAKENNQLVKHVLNMMSSDGSFIFYRKGIVGDWENHFTAEQSEKFDKVIKEQLKDTIFEP